MGYVMDINDRERGLEKKFEMDQSNIFRIEARASKLIGLWAADLIGLQSPEREAYAKDVVIANLDEPGYDDVKRKLISDFRHLDIEYDEAEIDRVIHASVTEATDQIRKENQG